MRDTTLVEARSVPWPKALSYLNASCVLGKLSPTTLCKSLFRAELVQMQELLLCSNRIGDMDVGILLETADASFPRLRRLVLSNNAIGDFGFIRICHKLMKHKHLEEIGLSGNMVQHATLEPLGEPFEPAVPVAVDLKGNVFVDESATADLPACLWIWKT